LLDLIVTRSNTVVAHANAVTLCKTRGKKDPPGSDRTNLTPIIRNSNQSISIAISPRACVFVVVSTKRHKVVARSNKLVMVASISSKVVSHGETNT
jgi:hypothetical protein